MGVLWTGVKALTCCAVRGRSFKEAYPAVTRRVDEILLEQYRGVLTNEAVADVSERKMKPKIAWVVWLQGFDRAPEMVKVCVTSQQQFLKDYEFRMVTEQNYHEWLTLPQHIIEKRRRGLIPDASFSDLLRLELLIRYGGLYMDATVLCTGFGNERLRTRWADIEASEWFFFRYFVRGQREPVGLSNWFFSTVAHHPVLAAVRNALFDYWRDYDCVVDYYVFHLFLGEMLRQHPEMVATMPRGNSFHSTMLGRALALDFGEEAWQDLTAHVSFHKLNFRKTGGAVRNLQSFYSRIFALDK